MKDDYSYWSENLHSAYLFYTMEVDKLNRENKRLREALERINRISCQYPNMMHGEHRTISHIAEQALGE